MARVRLGRVLGTPASAPVSPPAPLPPVFPPGRGARRLPASIKVAVEQMVTAYHAHAGYSPTLQRNVNGLWFGMLRRAAAALNAAGASPRAFVEYVVTLHTKRRTRPWPAQVFGERAVAKWLPEYLGRSLAVLPVPTYEASSERRLAYRERVSHAGRRIRAER